MPAGAERDRSPSSTAPAAMAGARLKSNLTVSALYEEAVRRGEGIIAAGGPLVCKTAPHTGRSPNDKFFVREPSSEREIAWGNNRPMSLEAFERLRADFMASLEGMDLYVQDCHAGADPQHRLPIRVITEQAWHSL